MSIFDKVHNSPKKKTTKPKKPKPKETQEPEKPKTKTAKKKDDPDKAIEKLVLQAQRAELEDTIHKAELSAYKVEKEKMILMKAAGDVAELPFMEFLYFGYMEKCNLLLLGLADRNEPRIANLAKENNTRGIIKLIKNEIKSILQDVKKQQTKDIKEWKKSL